MGAPWRGILRVPGLPQFVLPLQRIFEDRNGVAICVVLNERGSRNPEIPEFLFRLVRGTPVVRQKRRLAVAGLKVVLEPAGYNRVQFFPLFTRSLIVAALLDHEMAKPPARLIGGSDIMDELAIAEL